ncbi:LuxR C-terminal-related transcriptional regulator [Sporosarcina thermotolerans]|uniref:LuxR C-terminal-related transcriptional regulator n=1 Tax=Sporosarcina thermotolerans TaxID=633404 RepID=UPI0024BC5B6A|nr:LuxR C-terminal-related transcriptional regulator [Sporosarcina thermotolerans]WHT47403.1 LuxR C-terminal-related transcriptional regulator [Sporosarcina thermotolerans]
MQTDISWEHEAAKERFKRYIVPKDLVNFIRKLDNVKDTLLLDAASGIKIIFTPVKTKENRSIYFVIAGYIDKPQTDEMIANTIRVMPWEENPKAYEELSNKIDQIKTMTEAIASFTKMLDENKARKDFSNLISTNLNSINNGSASIQSLLDTGMFFEEIDFMGLAIKTAKHMFTIDTVIGDHNPMLLGYEFETGEGLMGYSAATKENLFIENMSSDARNRVFAKNKMHVFSLFCFPLFDKNEVIGLLFGGSIREVITNNDFLYDKFTICASLMNNYLLKTRMEKNNKDLQVESQLFEDILKVLQSAKDIKKSLYLLIDLSMNFTDFEFSSFVYKTNSTPNQIEILTRGMSEEEIRDYCHELAKKLMDTDFQTQADEWRMKKTSWNVDVLEFPFILDDAVHGILSIGYKSANSIEKYNRILWNLARASRIILFNNLNDNGTSQNSTELFMNWVEEILLHFRPTQYNRAQQIKITTSKFFMEIGIEETSAIDKIAILSVCGRELVTNVLKDKELIERMTEFYNVLDKKSSGSHLIEAVAAVWTYYTNDKSIESVRDLELIHSEIKTTFSSFIKRQKQSDQTIELTEDLTDEPSAPVNLGLSKREEEVLGEMMKGLSNKEIGGTLFISEHTVKNHVTNILSKLGVVYRSQAIAKMYQMGFGGIKNI